jgi:hypothetical protein
VAKGGGHRTPAPSQRGIAGRRPAGTTPANRAARVARIDGFRGPSMASILLPTSSDVNNFRKDSGNSLVCSSAYRLLSGVNGSAFGRHGLSPYGK